MIRRTDLATMLAIGGRESDWDPDAVQQGGEIGAPGVGVGWLQITPGTVADRDVNVCAATGWAYMNRDPGNPFEPWNLTADGFNLIFSTATLPGGGIVRTVLPSSYQYQVGGIAAGLVFPYGHAL
jgi:hypothetical protein